MLPVFDTFATGPDDTLPKDAEKSGTVFAVISSGVINGNEFSLPVLRQGSPRSLKNVFF